EIGPTSALLLAAGAVERLPDVLRGLAGDARAFIVSDAGLVRAGVLDRVRVPLEAAGVPYDLYTDVEANPTTDAVDRGIAALAAARAPGTVVVAVGGGSSMDTAKAMAMSVPNEA